MLLDIYFEKKIILGLFNDATNSSDCMTSNAGMPHWKGCGKTRSFALLRYYGITCLGKCKEPRNTSGRRVWVSDGDVNPGSPEPEA